MIKAKISLVVLYILNLIDYVQTIYAVQLYGLGVEANPLARILLKGEYAWVLKLILAPLAIMAIAYVVKIDKRWTWVLYLLVIFYLVIVINNFAVLLRLH